MEHVKTGTNYCPCCKELIDSATALEDEKVPKPNDLTLCLYCCAVLQFTDDMDLIEFPEVLIDTLEEDTKKILHKAMREINRSVPVKKEEYQPLRVKNIMAYESRISG